jgi:hypothetical protein
MGFNLKGIIKGLVIKGASDQSKKFEILVDETSTTNTKTTLSTASQTADRTIALPDASGTVVLEAASQSLTNKTIDGDLNTVQDVGISSLKTVLADADKFIVRDASGAVVSSKTVPTGAVVGISDSQVLTNKTIDGDDNTIQDLALSSLKTVLADANKFLTRDGSGAVVSSSTLSESVLPTGINANKIADGTVDNTEFQYLNGVTSSIQTQLGNKINSSEKGAVSGVATLDAGGKIPQAQIPAIALVDVYVVADIAARDALTVQEGDVAKVLDDGSGNVISFIYDGSAWVQLTTDEEVNAHAAVTTGIHGVSGNVVGTTDNQVLTNKTIDGDDNTVQDLALTSIKTVVGDANKVIRRNGSGVVVSDNSIPNSSALVTTDSSQDLSNKTFSGLSTDTISEKTTAAGVTIDSVLLKDGSVTVGLGNVVNFQSNVNKTTTVRGSPSASASVDYHLPPADGAANARLVTDGSGATSWSKKGRWQYVTASGQSIPNNTATLVDFNSTSSFLTNTSSIRTAGAGYNATLGTWTTEPKYTPALSGIRAYAVSGQIQFTNSTAWETAELAVFELMVNGNVFASMQWSAIATSASNIRIEFYLSKSLDLDNNDYIQVRILQNSDSAQVLTTDSNQNFIEIIEID